MNNNRLCLGWIAIAMSGAALVIAILGHGLGPRISVTGRGSFSTPGSFNQNNQQGQPGQWNNTQPNNQQGPNGTDTHGPRGHQQRSQTEPNTQQTTRPSWPRFEGSYGNSQGNASNFVRRGWAPPFRLFGAMFKLGMVALLVLLGFVLLRQRNMNGPGNQPAASSQTTQSATGETYTDGPTHEA